MSPAIWCLSPPCQPYSTASAGKGLHTVILHVLSLAEVQCLCLEQVQGFHSHQHFAFIREIWERVGYKCVWQGGVDLADFAPSSRKRFHAVLLRQELIPNPLPPSRRPVLGLVLLGISPVLQAPGRVHEPCLPAQAAASRLRTLQDRMGNIMASYHYQHELPVETLQRAGILATLLALPGEEPRFASGLEVAMLDCAVRPLLLHECDCTQMRLLGNCLTTPQAIVCLGHAIPMLRPQAGFDLDVAVQDRLRTDSAMTTLCCFLVTLAGVWPQRSWPMKLPLSFPQPAHGGSSVRLRAQSCRPSGWLMSTRLCKSSRPQTWMLVVSLPIGTCRCLKAMLLRPCPCSCPLSRKRLAPSVMMLVSSPGAVRMGLIRTFFVSWAQDGISGSCISLLLTLPARQCRFQTWR